MSKEKKLFTEFPPVSTGDWEQVIKKDLKGADYKTKLNWHTGEGVDVLPFYRRDDMDGHTALRSPENRSWQIRQPVTAQDVGEANAAARKALKKGADALTFTLDIRSSLDTLEGIGIQNQEAFSRLLQDIDLTETSLHFEAGLASPVMLAMLYNECEKRGTDPGHAKGSVFFDPYAFALHHGQLPAGEKALNNVLYRMADFCVQRLPGIKSLAIDARIYHNTGGTLVQELGYALATGSEYLAALSESGMDSNAIASAIHFNLSTGSNYFLEIAKFRAARILWRKVLKAYKADETNEAYLHGSSSEWNKTTYDPYVNMLRTTTEGMSAALAGCDAITLHPFDESFRRPDAFSHRIARNTQIILKEEAYLNKVSDPAAGSYYIETLTNKIADAAWSCFKEVEQQGGLLQAIRDGYIQAAISEAAETRDRAIATRERIFVGINQYPDMNDSANSHKSDEKSIVSLKKTGTDAAIQPAVLMASLKEALQNGHTLGDLLPAVFEVTRLDIETIHSYRGSQAFEALRKATDRNSKTPTVLTLPMGNKKMRKARSAFAVNLFGCVDYHIEDPIGFESTDDALEAVKKQHPDIVVLCSSDNEYEELVPDLCKKLNQLDDTPIIALAGYPKEHIEIFRKAGIDVFIHAKINVLETLRDFQQRLGIIKNDE